MTTGSTDGPIPRALERPEAMTWGRTWTDYSSGEIGTGPPGSAEDDAAGCEEEEIRSDKIDTLIWILQVSAGRDTRRGGIDWCDQFLSEMKRRGPLDGFH